MRGRGAPRHSRYPMRPRSAPTTIVTPAASAASNQNGSGKSVIRFDPGSKRYVPGGKNSTWNARNAGSKATAKRARASAAAPSRRRSCSISAPTRRGSRRMRTALTTASHRRDHGDAEEANEARHVVHVRPLSSFSVRAAGAPGISGLGLLEGRVEVAIGPDVGEELARHPLDLGLRRPERLRHPVPLLEEGGERGVEEQQRADEQDDRRDGDPKGSSRRTRVRAPRLRSGCQVAFRAAPITIESRNLTMLMTIAPSRAGTKPSTISPRVSWFEIRRSGAASGH